MANVIFVNDSKEAIDPDHVAHLNVERNEIRIDGHVLKLSPEDFQKVLASKEGKH